MAHLAVSAKQDQIREGAVSSHFLGCRDEYLREDKAAD